MAKSKVASKVANTSPPMRSTRIKLGDWVQEAYPEVWEQYCAIKDLEESVEQTDLQIHYQAHLHNIAMLDIEHKQSKYRIEQMLKEFIK